MLKKFYSTLIVFFLIANVNFAQNTLDHNTGSLLVTMFDNSYIGHTGAGTGGNGVTFLSGIDAMYTGGFVAGYSPGRTIGLIGSFSINDVVTTSPFSGFTSNANFNQIASAEFNDSNAPSGNMVGLSVTQRSLSNTGDNYMFIEYTITNTSGAAITDLYAGSFADWDVGQALYAQNRGGYDESRNLAYMWLNNAADPNYYGMVALTGLSGARVTTEPSGAAAIRDSTFRFISTFLNEPTPGAADSDYRMWIGSGPFSLADGASAIVGVAIAAGASLIALQASADLAQAKWNSLIVDVAQEENTPLTFNLGQNYPNPFNPSTSIKFSIPESGNVKLVVYNLLGQEITTVINSYKEAGNHEVTFEASDLSSGIYFYSLEANGSVQIKKMSLLK